MRDLRRAFICFAVIVVGFVFSVIVPLLSA